MKFTGRCGSNALMLLAVAALPVQPVWAQAHVEPTEAPPSAQTNDTAQARTFFEIGAQAYEAGDYVAALEAFHEAYAHAGRPGLLFSIAQAHRRAFLATHDQAQLAGAIEHYRKYLASGHSARRTDAQLALEQLVPLAGSARSDPAFHADPSSARLMIASPTPGAVLHVDGAPAPRLPYVAAVAPGTHRLTLSAPGFRTQERELPIPPGTAFGLELALEELPGTLMVTARSDAELWVDGRLIGVLPLPRLTLKAGPHQVSVRKSGYRLATRRITVERGGSRHLDLPLEPTLVRSVSVGLLWAGAGIALAGAATGFAAYAQEREAVRMHERIATGSASAAELEQYNDALSVRNGLRTATIGLASVGIGCVLAGAALFVFERAEPPALLEGESESGEPVPRNLSTEIIAGLRGEQLGIQARGRF